MSIIVLWTDKNSLWTGTCLCRLCWWLERRLQDQDNRTQITLVRSKHQGLALQHAIDKVHVVTLERLQLWFETSSRASYFIHEVDQVCHARIG